MVENLLSTHRVLGLIPSIGRKKIPIVIEINDLRPWISLPFSSQDLLLVLTLCFLIARMSLTFGCFPEHSKHCCAFSDLRHSFLQKDTMAHTLETITQEAKAGRSL